MIEMRSLSQQSLRGGRSWDRSVPALVFHLHGPQFYSIHTIEVHDMVYIHLLLAAVGINDAHSRTAYALIIADSFPHTLRNTKENRPRQHRNFGTTTSLFTAFDRHVFSSPPERPRSSITTTAAAPVQVAPRLAPPTANIAMSVPGEPASPAPLVNQIRSRCSGVCILQTDPPPYGGRNGSTG